MHPHHWVRSPGSYLLNDSGLVAGDGIEPPSPAYETGLEPLQLSRKKFVRIFSCQRPQTLAQGEGLEPPPTGLEPVMLPVTPTLRIKPWHCKNWTRAEVSNLDPPPKRWQGRIRCIALPTSSGLTGHGKDNHPLAGPVQGWFLPSNPGTTPHCTPYLRRTFPVKGRVFPTATLRKPSRNTPWVVRFQPERIRRRKTGYDRCSTVELRVHVGSAAGLAPAPAVPENHPSSTRSGRSKPIDFRRFNNSPGI